MRGSEATPLPVDGVGLARLEGGSVDLGGREVRDDALGGRRREYLGPLSVPERDELARRAVHDEGELPTYTYTTTFASPGAATKRTRAESVVTVSRTGAPGAGRLAAAADITAESAQWK